MKSAVLSVPLACTLVSLFGISSLQAAAADPSRPQRLKESPVLEHLKPNPVSRPPETAPEQTVAKMWVEEGFRAELVVAEPDLHQPIAFAFDERGRIWVAEAYSYPQKRLKGEGLDKIVIFEDQNGDGKFETRKVFAEGLNLVSGFEVGYGGVWVGAAPELFFIPDKDGNDRPDGEPQVLLEGFGYQDTHETLNNFLWGPDGWLYGNQGVFNYSQIGKPGSAVEKRVEMRAGVWRYHPVRHEFEVFAHGGSNQWGLDFDEFGQFFMTHCRSYYGRGPTTHVALGGHYWNQANQHYAPFISANAPEEYWFYRNYMLSSARYDHGEGGAGKAGSGKIYGGHSHIGTMLYLGDNWPDTYRNHVFTHNLHGHQMNHQVNRPFGSGYDTIHAGNDVFYCEDPGYIGVDLAYGPDGAVYVIDWYDRQHCHNPNTEQWDRSNGRIYRIQYDKTFKPRMVDLAKNSDAELIELQLHHNDWYTRTARRLLHERAVAGKLDSGTKETVLKMAREHADPSRRVRALWVLHAINGFSDDVARDMLGDKHEYIRAWTVQFITEDGQVSSALEDRLREMAEKDPSKRVRLYLASAVQRVPDALAWNLIEALAAHGEDQEDRNLPLMTWYGLALRMPENLDRAFAVASKTRIPALADYVYWYAAKLEKEGLDRVLALFAQQSPERQKVLLAGLSLALEDKAKVPMPKNWPAVAQQLYASPSATVRRQAEEIAGVLGDSSIFPRLREVLNDRSSDLAEKQHAFAVLSKAQDRESLQAFIGLLDDPEFRGRAIPVLGRFESPQISEALIAKYASLPAQEKAAALNAMTARKSLAIPLFQGIASGKINRGDLTAYHIRQLSQLDDPEINQHLTANWGKVSSGAGEKKNQIERLEKIFNEAPLWAYSEREGKRHFQTLCASCHKLKEDGNRLGPELTGAGANGIRYYLENVIDPNAVIGQDYQMMVVSTRNGDVVSGILESDSGSAITIRTASDRVVIAKSDIAEKKTGEQSMMPEGLLEALKEREQIELLKYLTSN